MEIFVLVMIVVAAGVAFAIINPETKKGLGKIGGTKGKQTPITAKTVLTMNEQPTFHRLKEALPEYSVLAQVSFCAMITATGWATRNRFNRKMADFVICDKAFNVVAVVELDDSSHKGREDKDAERDAMLTEAGLKVIRYKRTPSKEQIRKDLGL